MFPKIATLGPFTLHTYGLLLAVAFLVALWVVAREARRTGLEPARITDLSIYVLLAGLVGARVLLVAVDWNRIDWNWRDLLNLLQSGGVFYGGLLGALPVAWWYVRRHRLPGWATADVLIPGVAIGQSIGRLGCLCAGCCYGRPTDVPWAITFRNVTANREIGTPLDVPIHPTQIYESLATLGIFFVLLAVARRKKFDGQVLLTYLALYAVARFVIEIYRGDAARGTVFSGLMSTSQLIAVVMFFAALVLLPVLAKKGRVGTRPA